MTFTNKGLVEFAKQMLALGDDTIYVYGTFGRTITESLINQKAVQYVYNFPRKALYKEVMNSEGTEYAFDCVGLIKAYYWGWKDGKTDYKSSQDKSANGMHTAAKVKGKIETMPEVPGLLVHMSGHIGIYIGDGYVIECTPTTTFAKQKHNGGGVCKTKLTDRKWVNWCECPFITYEEDKTEEEKHAEEVAANAKKWGLKVPTKIEQGERFYLSKHATFYGGASLGTAIPPKIKNATTYYKAGKTITNYYKNKKYTFVLAKEINSYVRVDECMMK